MSSSDSGNICNYCHEKGHWKADCPVLKGKARGTRTVKPVAFVAPVKGGGVLSSQPCDRDALSAYVPFIPEGTVSLLGSDVKVPIKILWDTGAYDLHRRLSFAVFH